MLESDLDCPPKVLRGGISKVNLQETLSIFGDKCPRNGSKTAPTAPRPHLGYPHIGPFVACNTVQPNRLQQTRLSLSVHPYLSLSLALVTHQVPLPSPSAPPLHERERETERERRGEGGGGEREREGEGGRERDRGGERERQGALVASAGDVTRGGWVWVLPPSLSPTGERGGARERLSAAREREGGSVLPARKREGDAEGTQQGYLAHKKPPSRRILQ